WCQATAADRAPPREDCRLPPPGVLYPRSSADPIQERSTMSEQGQPGGVDRRTFLRGMAGIGGAVFVAGCGGGGDAALVADSTALAGDSAAAAGSTARWLQRPGIQLYTVRDLTENDLEGTLVQLAQIGFREVEPTGYGDYTPQQYRELLDRVGLTAPSTHANLVPGPDLERQLEGYAVLGHRYARAATQPPGRGGGRSPNTEESWKERAAIYNQIGQAASAHGIRVLLHNRAGEFAPLDGSTLRPQDVLLAETDPEYVVFELDIGWSSVAGQDAL